MSSVVYGGVDTSIFHPNLEVEQLKQELNLAECDVVLYVGRVMPHKGIETLIKALPSLPRDTKLLIVGPIVDREYYEYLSTLANKANPENVLFTGSVKTQELAKYYNVCDVFVQPSTYYDYRGRYHRFPELLGLTKFEAMACGKPVIVSNVGGLPEQVINGKNGYVIRAGDETKLGEVANILLADRKLNRDIGREGLKLVKERFTWRAVAQHVLKLYKSI
jgi:phosphatidylinositol alpha-1,6-mannosyltransferase